MLNNVVFNGLAKGNGCINVIHCRNHNDIRYIMNSLNVILSKCNQNKKFDILTSDRTVIVCNQGIKVFKILITLGNDYKDIQGICDINIYYNFEHDSFNIMHYDNVMEFKYYEM
jgi:hypothetical protein